MSTFLVVLAFMLVIMAAMAVGVILGRRPIAGTCGGLNKLGLKEGCEVCGGKDEVCDEENRKRQGSARRRSDESRGADLGYDATKR
ncbi:(Na+)-NQR maturation NqrM [Halomonas maura]|uniref:(Na+)-NQR maturation NqrM n=1 Tax=Halomonas maura TaxID=117606 RepID=UPI0025B415D8|nr:(Na+)-NQR maturation NqrM [Halomonas maura]MDN3555278.1 (Na+)-NQR maturation NqrM [Halomonas maura]